MNIAPQSTNGFSPVIANAIYTHIYVLCCAVLCVPMAWDVRFGRQRPPLCAAKFATLAEICVVLAHIAFYTLVYIFFFLSIFQHFRWWWIIMPCSAEAHYMHGFIFFLFVCILPNGHSYTYKKHTEKHHRNTFFLFCFPICIYAEKWKIKIQTIM